MIDVFRDIQTLLLDDLDITTKRFLYHEIDLTPRLIGIVGPRGVGKTTLFLQLLKENTSLRNESFYFSADHFYFSNNSLFDFIRDLHLLEGVSRVFIDEIHKYPDWNQELKNIYDSFPRLHIVFSGSSTLDLIQGSYDLSRRAVLFRLPGLSFREYLNLRLDTHFDKISLNTIVTNPQSFRGIASMQGLLGHFRTYLATGYYPFYFSDSIHFYQRLQRVIDKIIYEDIANHYRLKTANLHYFKKLLYYLATIPPVEINTHSLAKNLGIDDKTVQHYIQILLDTGLARGVPGQKHGSALLRKPTKLYLDNPSMQHALCHEIGAEENTGTLRELFFLTSLMNVAEKPLYDAGQGGDFRVRDIVFEIGGKNKRKNQLKDVKEQSFIVKDDILTASASTIPLYCFGFLY